MDFDIQEPGYLAGIRALGIIDKVITGPYWRLLEKEGGIYNLNTHLHQMKISPWRPGQKKLLLFYQLVRLSSIQMSSKCIICLFVCLFVCGISLPSGQLVSELFPDCTRSCFSQVVLHRRGGDRIYEMRCLFVAVGPNARFIVLPHCYNMS